METKISEAEKNITQKESEYEERKKVAQDVLVAMYEQGETTYLDVLLSSASIIDFISNYHLMSELTDYNIEFLETIEKRSKKNFNVEVTEEDSVLTLSTCANNNKYRVVLHAKKVN